MSSSSFCLPVTFRKKLTAQESQRNFRFLVTTPPESARSQAQSAPTSRFPPPTVSRQPLSAGSTLPGGWFRTLPKPNRSSLLPASGVVQEITTQTSPQTCLAISVQSCERFRGHAFHPSAGL